MDRARSSIGLSESLAAPRRVSFLSVAGLASLCILMPACADEFDTSRTLPKRGTVGEEMFGVICDRVGAQALREDMTGESFRKVCHKPTPKGAYADTVDESALPPMDPQAIDTKGRRVSIETQKKNRAYAVGRIEALARRRTELIQAFDASFPERNIPIKDLANPDETKTCQAPKKKAEGLLTDQVADMLGKMGDLYNDGTLPQSTESLARVFDEFKKSDEAQSAWARLSARQGYRPIDTALGATRPIVAYPQLRDLANSTLRLLSADSNPYELKPKHDGDGNRIPVPGIANAALNKMLEAAQHELRDSKADPIAPALVATPDAQANRTIISRPRDNVEMLDQIFFATDASFGGGDSRYIVRRDSRGYAAFAGGSVPAPFVDSDQDGLPDVDAVGRFVTNDSSIAPSPFPVSGITADNATRDELGRALVNNKLLYDYVDTSHTYAAQMLVDMKPLVNPDPEARHETLMDLVGGMYVSVGPREQKQKSYETGSITYDAIPTDSPMIDLVYALGTLMGDQNMDATLGLAQELFTNQQPKVARLTGSMISAMDIAHAHPEAKIAREVTFWDDTLATMVKIAKEPRLLEDMLIALGDPNSANLGSVFANYAKVKDSIVYDKNNLNGPTWNETTNSTGEMITPVDRGDHYTGKNRSALARFLGLIADTTGVASCNKPGAKVHAKLGSISVTMPLFSSSYGECEVFKIDNLAAFYLDSIANAQAIRPGENPPPGAFYLRDNTLREGIAGIGKATVDLMENSSNLTGFWTDGGSTTLAAKPAWLNRLVFFDFPNDNVNTQTRNFIGDLSGEVMGTSVCPERTITDPKPDSPDASPDGIVHGLRNCPDGQWLQQRGHGTIFTWEHFGFYDAIRPVLSAFVKHKREDLFLELSNTVNKYYLNAEASADECRQPGGGQCARGGLNAYEGLISEQFATDLVPALSELMKALELTPIKRCDETDAKGVCTPAGAKIVSGIDVAAAATRAALDPDYAKNTLKLTDRKGNTGTQKNDGTPIAQVTPAYLLTNALSAIDAAYDTYEQAHPEETSRRENFRRARSQLVDQFMGVTGGKSTSVFANPMMKTLMPKVVDLIRSQLLAHCPKSFSPPYQRCDWARDELAQKAETTFTGPLMSSGLEMMDEIRRDADGRKQMGLLLTYLLDEGSKNDALASTAASANDLLQLLRDEQNLVPLYHVLSAAFGASKVDSKGRVIEKSLVDAQMALLARVSGRYVDDHGKEICSREIDPNQVLSLALANLVTPINDGDFKGQSPLEVIIDVVADVNRVDPTQPYEGTLAKDDYSNVTENVVDFLMNKERGLEQFYEVIRQGTKF
ncbi:hypothetical protein AKJ09_06034 [Labilithrix luteola]|uniref:Uncharacterized protein n=1 Tax=Labilithrix luteola TaxID=1391654 RepID=A0A0K1Q0Q9_9BACT|nr:hypothetical protein [Labilithrix luteola]AKU99370.1 hypothetical protein AKJ09_06034 [Labilithrix luteola]